MMKIVFLFCVFFLGITLINAICPNPDMASNLPKFQFKGKGKTCDDVNNICKNFLSCVQDSPTNTENKTCIETYQGMNCTSQYECGEFYCAGTGLLGNQVGQCVAPRSLASGEMCMYDIQCQSGSCGIPPNTTKVASQRTRSLSSMWYQDESHGFFSRAEQPVQKVCSPDATTNGTACASQGDCQAGYWCNLRYGKCEETISYGKDCSDSIHYGPIPVPNYVCKSGSGCQLSSSKNEVSKFTCVKYYSKGKGSICFGGPTTTNPSQGWWNCKYGYYCTGNSTDIPGECKEVHQSGAIGDECKNFPFTPKDQKECPWGSACDCFTSSKTSKGECKRVFNTNCEDELDSYVSCMKKNDCPHDPQTIVGHIEGPFAGGIALGSCAMEHCQKKHGSLIRCQNLDVSSKYSPANIPKKGPNSVHQSSSGGLAGWEIGLIIVGIAVAVIIIVVVVVALVRRKKQPDGYEALH